MKCYQCQKPIKAPAAVCVVVANWDEWPRLTVYFASLEANEPEPRRPVCDMYFIMCSPPCTALWWSYAHQVLQDKLEHGGGVANLQELLRVH